MREIDVDQNTPEWLEARLGTISGSRAKDILSPKKIKKIGYYELLAERLAIPADEEDVRDRGHRLEDEAIEHFEKHFNVKVEKSGIWVSDEHPRLIISPDGHFRKVNAVEVKCLKTALQLKAILEGTFPKEYKPQALHYFVVNENIQRLYFVMYDPRLPNDMQLVYFILKRSDYEKEIEAQKKELLQTLKEIDEHVINLSFK